MLRDSSWHPLFSLYSFTLTRTILTNNANNTNNILLCYGAREEIKKENGHSNFYCDRVKNNGKVRPLHPPFASPSEGYHSPDGCDGVWAPIIKRPVGRCTYVHTLSFALFKLHSAIVFLVLQMTMTANVINYQWIIGSGALAVLLVLLVFLLQF